MRYSRAARAAVIFALATLGFATESAVSGAEGSDDEVYGMTDAIDPLAEWDWAPAIRDAEVEAAAADGAVVTDAPCTFGDRPGTPISIFRRPVRTTGHLVVTPSGNVSFVCHAAADARSFQRPLPTQAIVVDRVPCFLPNGRRTNDTHLVVTPSLQVHLTCHVQPAG
jgi:hypothetical protein